MKILGISCFYHDSAAALLIDGKIVAAAQEERFTRKKHDDGFPIQAISFCLGHAGISVDDLDYVVFYDKPLLKFERLLQTYIRVWPKGLRSFVTAMRVWLKFKLWVEYLIAKKLNYNGKILFTEHHYSHGASAYYASPFDEATVITMDGVGEWDTTTVGQAKDNSLRLTHTIHFPHSLGLLYSAFTYYLGFKVNSAEYKVMGLAPYGNQDIYYKKIKELITVKPDGSFAMNMKYFSYEYGETMTNKYFDELFGGPPRHPEEVLTQRHKDIAASLQKVTEEVVLKIAEYAKSLHPSDNLCMAGGVALNCVANGKILERGIFKNIFIQPGSGDAGGAVGAACYLYFDILKHPKPPLGVMTDAYLGPEFNETEITTALEKKSKEMKIDLTYHRLSEDELIARAAQLLEKDYVIGWFQGRMEFGPRALGNRSILADARDKNNWQRVNLKIKFRESFRPFAPTVLEEKADLYFDLKGHKSPYMLLVAPVKTRSIPAVTHVDNSARIQTINNTENQRFYKLIKEFDRRTGCAVVINTSFNVRGEPIVCTPENAINCFIHTDIDYLVMGNFLLAKEENLALNKERNIGAYLNKFELD